MEKSLQDVVRILPIGGCGEIGMNMTAINTCGRWIFVDCGVLMPSGQLPGVDMVVPKADDLKELNIVPDAWVFTHAHEDHIGALPWVYDKLPAPIYATRMTQEFLKSKIPPYALIHELKMGQTCALPGCQVTPLGMTHSLPEAVGLHLDTPAGGVFITGDFRMGSKRDGEREMASFFASHPVSLLLADSTNALVPGRDREEDELVEHFASIMRETSGCCVVISFASSLWRYHTVLEAAQRTDRRVHFFGRSLERNLEIARSLGITDGFEDVIVAEDQVSGLERQNLCIIASGSQGEAFSGAFRLAQSHVDFVKLGRDDTVVLSARTIPGNERAVGALLNQFARLGARIVTPRERLVHVSGHGFQDDLRELIRLARPRFFVPVHGEHRHLRAHASLAESEGLAAERCIVVENGNVVCLTSHGCSIEPERVTVGRLHVAQGVAAEARCVRERARLAHAGHIVVSLVMNGSGLPTEEMIEVLVLGVPVSEETVRKLTQTALTRILTRKRKAVPGDDLSETIRLAIRRGVEQQTGGFRAVVSVLFHSSRDN